MSCAGCGAALSADARFCPACGAQVAATEPTSARGGAATAAMIGKQIAGRYRILEKLGEGGMGAVFRAEQISLKRTVALKLLRPELSANAGLVRRFNAEAELAAKLSHPGTVTLFDFGQDADGALFIAMELVEGQSLREVIVREGAMPPTRALAIAEQVCASLADAHAHGIVHRDLKPDNVMLTRRGAQTDIVRVLDFGIAKLRDERGDGAAMPLTQHGDLLGTPQYMAPEQIRGETVDGRTDVYALGAMLYEMVTARLPFEGHTVMAILSKHLTEVPVPPMDRRRDLGIPPQVSAVVMDCLQKDPAARPRSMDDLGQRLANVRGLFESAHPVSAGRPAAMPLKRTASRPPGVRWTPPDDAPPTPRAPEMPPPSLSLPPPGGGWGAGPPQSPSPTPTPMGEVVAPPAPRASRSWLWAVLGLAVAGGGVALGLVLQNRDAGDGAGEAGGATTPTAPAETGDEGFRSPIGGDFSTDPKRRLFELQGQLDEVEDTLAELEALRDDPLGGFPGGGAATSLRWVHPRHGFALTVPDGFAAPSGTPEMMMSTGAVDGRMSVIVAVTIDAGNSPLPVSFPLGDTELEAAARQFATGFQGSVIEIERHRVWGASSWGGTYAMPDGTRMQAVLYPGASFVLAVAFGTPDADDFAATAAARRRFFDQAVEPP